MDKAVKQYNNLTLKELAEKLHVKYYNVILALAQQANERLSELKKTDLHLTTAHYTEVCDQLLQRIFHYLQDRKEVILPYISELHEKDVTGHNCGNCSGSCDMGHKSHFIALRESHIQITKLLFSLQSAALPLYSNLAYPQLYRSLRYEMLLIDTVLRELLFVEEANLMTEIVKSQKNINVHS